MKKEKYVAPTLEVEVIEIEQGIASASHCPGNSCNAPGHNKGNEDYEHPGGRTDW